MTDVSLCYSILISEWCGIYRKIRRPMRTEILERTLLPAALHKLDWTSCRALSGTLLGLAKIYERSLFCGYSDSPRGGVVADARFFAHSFGVLDLSVEFLPNKRKRGGFEYDVEKSSSLSPDDEEEDHHPSLSTAHLPPKNSPPAFFAAYADVTRTTATVEKLLLDYFVKAERKVCRTIKNFRKGPDVVHILYAYALFGHGSSELFSLLLPKLHHAVNELDTYYLSRVMWSFGRLRLEGCVGDLTDRVKVCCIERANQFRLAHLGDVLWALAVLRSEKDDGFFARQMLKLLTVENLSKSKDAGTLYPFLRQIENGEEVVEVDCAADTSGDDMAECIAGRYQPNSQSIVVKGRVVRAGAEEEGSSAAAGGNEKAVSSEKGLLTAAAKEGEQSAGSAKTKTAPEHTRFFATTAQYERYCGYVRSAFWNQQVRNQFAESTHRDWAREVLDILKNQPWSGEYQLDVFLDRDVGGFLVDAFVRARRKKPAHVSDGLSCKGGSAGVGGACDSARLAYSEESEDRRDRTFCLFYHSIRNNLHRISRQPLGHTVIRHRLLKEAFPEYQVVNVWSQAWLQASSRGRVEFLRTRLKL